MCNLLPLPNVWPYVWIASAGLTANEAEQDTKPKAAVVNARVSVPLFQGQFDAVVSWTYNLGAYSTDSCHPVHGKVVTQST